MEKTAIIIPAYNEEKRIGKTLEEYAKFFEEKKKVGELRDFEILVVLNACKDNTLEIVKEKQRKYKEISFLNFEQGGKGFAITEGFKYALKRDNELMGFVDADMATPPNAFYDLIKNINKFDGVLASRWLKESIIKTKQTPLRIITSRGFNFLVRSILFLPYIDTQCGAKLFRKKAIESVINDLGTTKWAFDIDLIYRLKKNGFKIKEIPTIWEDKRGSKLNVIKVPFQMFSSIIRLRLIYSPFNFIVRFYNKLPEKIRIHNW
ncbi:MAG: glycosyltransferase [Candidatus Pacearchaeota archaeon]